MYMSRWTSWPHRPLRSALRQVITPMMTKHLFQAASPRRGGGVRAAKGRTGRKGDACVRGIAGFQCFREYQTHRWLRSHTSYM